MNNKWELYETKLNAYGETTRERQLEQAREDFYREAVKNPAYHKALRNGVEEDFLIQRTDKTERFKITAFPGNDLNIGDYIEVWGEVFLVYQTRVQNTLNKTGILWLCNHLFRWQNFTPEIIERWGILDSGVYSTTIRGEDDVKYKNKQFKMILPLDDDTKKLYIDKRIAVDTMYDRNGTQILNVYQITGYDSTGENFGAGSHILYLNLRSDEYDDEADSLEEVICNYIPPEEDEPIGDEDLVCSISGSSVVRIGASRKLKPKFFNADGEEVDGVTAVWSSDTLPTGVTIEPVDNNLVVRVADDTTLLGEIIKVYLTADGYMTAKLDMTIKAL